MIGQINLKCHVWLYIDFIYTTFVKELVQGKFIDF